MHLLLSAALLAGLGTTAGLGETGASPVLAAEARFGPLGAEGYWTDADKYTGEGWILRGAADAHLGPAFFGAVRSHRNGGPWSRDTWWVRGGLERRGLWLLYEHALGPNRERKIEARFRVGHKQVIVESRVFREWHAQGVGHGVALLVGIGGSGEGGLLTATTCP